MSDLFDKAKNLLAENSDTVDDVVDKVAGLVDDKTGGKHKDKVQQGAAKAKDAIAQLAGDDPTEKPAKKPGAKKPGAKQAGKQATGAEAPTDPDAAAS